MRTLLILALCVAVLAAIGVVHFRKSGDQVNVSIDTGELRDKTEELIDAVTDTLSDSEEHSDVSDRFDELMDDAREAIDATEDRASELFERRRH
jgi:hypothetical protein